MVDFLPVIDVSPEFPNAVTAARDEGKDERTFCLWLWPPVAHHAARLVGD